MSVGLTRTEAVGTSAKHGSREPGHHDRLGLDVDVPVELTGAPPADHFDLVVRDAGA